MGLHAYFLVGGAPLPARSFLLLVRVSYMKSMLGELSKTTLRICFAKGGGVPSLPLSFFGQNDFPLGGGGGYPPIPLRKKSAKKRLFLAKNANFSPF